jgi:hypothetical protein
MTTTRHTHPDQLDTTRLKAALPASPAHDDTARRLQEHTSGRWSVWYGHSTGRYWAIRKPPGIYGLVEGATPDDLITAMNEVDAFYGGRLGADLRAIPQRRS